MKWKKVFVEKEDWKRLIMELPRLKVEYTTQLFVFDMPTLVVTILVGVIAFIVGSVIF